MVTNKSEPKRISPIAICGYSHRLPGGLEDDRALWELLSSRGYVQEPIDQRYGKGSIPWDGFVDSPKMPASPYEGLIKDGKGLEFDASLFGMSANDAMRTDPQIKMLLAVTWEALESVGLDQLALHNSNTGVFVGCQDSSRFGWKAPYGATSADMPGKTGSMIANRISYHFNWMGPSMSIGTACSSAITALDAAIKSLDVGECNMAAFGAVNYLGLLDTSIGFKELGIISKTGTCRSFDKDANGYMRSEGAFMFILKRLEDAERDGDHVFGVIRGCGLNAAGAELDADLLTQGRTIFAPVGHAQQQLFERVSKQAGVDPQEVDYVEAHATGTPVGDKIEGRAIAAVYGSAQRLTPLRLASARSNLGHMEASSFASSLLKVMLMFKNRQFLPISSHYKSANPNIPFESKSIHVLTECEPFPEREKAVVVAINSFGFGGANGHCLVEEYKASNNWSSLPGENPNKVYMFPLSAKSKDALVKQARQLAEEIVHLDQKADCYSVAANLSARSTHHRVRATFSASSFPQLKDQLVAFVGRADAKTLKEDETGTVLLRRVSTEATQETKAVVPTVLMVFPGQGSQWAGCGRELYETELVFRRVVDAIDAEWLKLAGCKLSDVAFDVNIGAALNECRWAQPVTFLIQAALFETFKAHGVHPNAVLGHSAGEAAAAYASGAYTVEEACFLVFHRSQLQNKLAGSGRMLVLMQDKATVASTLVHLGFLGNGVDGGDIIDIACFNSPSNTVVCGPAPVIARLQKRLEEDGQPSGKLIPGNIAFHSRWTTPIREELVATLAPLGNKDTSVPFISTVTGTFLKTFDASYWWDNVRQPVNLIDAMNVARVHVEPDVIIEISPHITLQSPIRDCYNNVETALPTYVYTMIRKTDAAYKFARSLGSCFMAGNIVDFKTVYPRPRPLTHLLPKYPMKRDRMMDDLVDDSALLQKESFSAGPLLGKEIQGDRMQYQVVISKSHFPWLAEHVVQEAIVPAAGYIELLLQAFGGEQIHVVNAQFLAPFIINDDPKYLQTDIEPCPHAPGRHEFKITSRPHASLETASTIHCTGIVEKLSEQTIPLSVPILVPRSLSEDNGQYTETLHETAKSFYNSMAARVGEGYAYGTCFQGVSRVDRDRKTMRLRVEVTIDQLMWSNWDRMGYVFHPTMLDGALQSFIAYILDAADFAGVPRMLNLAFLKKPSGSKIVCVYEPPEYLRQNMHIKGQLAFGLGERSAGKITIYDGETGDLVAYIGEYNCFHSNTRKADLKKTKHFLSWQPKSHCFNQALLSKMKSMLRDETDLTVAAKRLIQEIVSRAHPEASTPFFLNVAECILVNTPTHLSLKECADAITDAPVQYTMIASDEEFLSGAYQEFGTNNTDANLRFVLSGDSTEDELLRPGMFELLIMRASEPHCGLDTVVHLVAPGGLVLVESVAHDTDTPSGWTCVFDGGSIQLLQAPGLSPSNKLVGVVPVSHDSQVVVDDTLGFSKVWRRTCGLSNNCVTFEDAAQWKRVDYFAMSKDDAVLFDGPAKLTEWLQQFASARSSDSDPTPCIFTIFTSGATRKVESPSQAGVWGAVRSLALELSDACRVDFRLIDIDDVADLSFVREVEKMRERELCVHQGRVWTSRLINDRQAMTVAELDAADETAFRLETDNSGVLADLAFRTMDLPILGPNDVEIAIKGSALNFRDIMVGLGRLPHLSYERSALGRTVGMECAGIVVKCGDAVTKHKIGDKVITMQGGSVANRLRCVEDLAVRLPHNMTCAQGASVLSVYVTAYYSLIHLAMIQEGTTVLIHSALGGVGQAAIALAKMKGALVYGTAGSHAKRKALREMGCLDAFDSHSTDWYRGVIEATKGRGVDVVLNSLAGQHVNLCLEALAAGGWHCEIGKVDIFANRPLRMAVFRKNLTYRAVDIDRLMMDNPKMIAHLTEKCLELLSNAEVPPLPITTFSYSNFQSALNIMMNGQHRGKLVLTPPKDGSKVSVIDNRPIFGTGPDGAPRTVLLSGCMGGFGLRVLAYVIAAGAKHVLLLDRDSQRRRSVQWLKEAAYIDFAMGDCSDVQIEIIYADVTKYEEVVKAVAATSSLGLPSIGSVFHLAGVLDDKFVQDLDRDSFAKVYAPKANGAWNLHRATLDCREIEHFVMFSSISSAFGNAGQTNYSAANAFQDGLAQYRQEMGKPGLAFCMGAVIETGMASRNPHVLEMMRANGLPAISCIFAIESLDAALRAPGRSNWIAALAANLPAEVESSDFLRTNAQLVQNSDAYKLDGGASLSQDAIMELVGLKVSALCGVESVDPKEPFGSYGLNSISVAELSGFIKQDMSYSVTAMELMTSATCESIALGVLEENARASGKKSASLTKAAGLNRKKASILGTDGGSSSFVCQVRTPSRFAPALEEHFEQHCEPSSKPLELLPLTDDRGAHSLVMSPSSSNDSLGEVNGTLPGPCQETLDSLLAYSKSFDVKKMGAACSVEAVHSVMLTGATGFLGRHFIPDLLNRTDVVIEKIYCPVRAIDDEKAMQRVVNAMIEVGLWSESYRPRICAFSGDLNDDQFGVTPDFYKEISEEIDAIYHFASSLNLSAPFDLMGESNCMTMRPVIRLCLTGHLKHLFHASTLGIFPQYFCQFANDMADKPILRNAMPDIALMKRVFPLVIGGYSWSKLINELVAFTLARTKGIPLAVFRLPVMFVNGRTGYTVANDPVVRMIQGYLQTGLNAGLPPLVIEDADVCGSMLLSVSLNPAREHVIYHCSRQSHRVFTECSYLGMTGYNLTPTSYPEFREISQRLGSESPLHVYWLLYDHFAPYWFQYWRTSGHFPIDTSTVDEDHCTPLPGRPNALTLLKDSRAWALSNEHLWPYDVQNMRVALEMDMILEPARNLCTKYGIDFNDCVPQYALEGLSRICDEVDVPSRVMPTAVFDLTSKLEARIHLHRLLKMHPEIAQEEIEAPVFILGLNRTGTTFLHRMLIASGSVAAPHLEEQFLLPHAEMLSNPTQGMSEEHVGYVRSMFDELITSLQGIHDIGVGKPEEELGPHSLSFMSLEYDILYGLPKYVEWLDGQSLEEVYHEHRRWLQFVTWSRRRAGKPVPRWCLKLPWHARSLEALNNVYPDAVLVHTHRPPKDVTGSWLSLVESQRKRFLEQVDRTTLGAEQTAILAETLKRAMAFREQQPQLKQRWLDIYFTDIVHKPLYVAKSILAHANVPVDDVVTSAISSFVDESTAQHKKSKLHKYNINDYGIQKAAFRTGVFQEYCAKYFGDEPLTGRGDKLVVGISNHADGLGWQSMDVVPTPQVEVDAS